MTCRYAWLLFDADGTLLDYERAEQTALETAFALHSVDWDSEAHQSYRSINAALWREFEEGLVDSATLRVRRFERLFVERGWDLDARRFSETYLRSLGSAGFRLPGVDSMLDALPAACGKAVVTNGIRGVQFGRLRTAGLLERFSHIIVSEDAGAAKPDPVFFDHCFERIGFYALDRMIIIGDSLSSDIAGGHRAGIDTCWYNPDRQPNDSEWTPSYEIADWSDLPAVLAGET